MRRHVIIGRFGPDDRMRFPLGEGEIETQLNLVDGELSLGHGIGRALGDLARLGVYPSEIGVDVLIIAAHVHAADTRISRTSESHDGWTREIRLIVPVSDSERWTTVAPTFVRMLNFLTGEPQARQVAIAGVYRRGLEEVGALLAGVRTRPG